MEWRRNLKSGAPSMERRRSPQSGAPSMEHPDFCFIPRCLPPLHTRRQAVSSPRTSDFDFGALNVARNVARAVFVAGCMQIVFLWALHVAGQQ
eukprot:350819-Chlamydomonas_euryale.AAC.4